MIRYHNGHDKHLKWFVYECGLIETLFDDVSFMFVELVELAITFYSPTLLFKYRHIYVRGPSKIDSVEWKRKPYTEKIDNLTAS